MTFNKIISSYKNPKALKNNYLSNLTSNPQSSITACISPYRIASLASVVKPAIRVQCSYPYS